MCQMAARQCTTWVKRKGLRSPGLVSGCRALRVSRSVARRLEARVTGDKVEMLPKRCRLYGAGRGDQTAELEFLGHGAPFRMIHPSLVTP
jgi:hypothetical protein